MHNERPRLTSKGKRGIAHILLQVKARVRDESHDEDAALLPRHVAWAEEGVPTLRAALHSYDGTTGIRYLASHRCHLPVLAVLYPIPAREEEEDSSDESLPLIPAPRPLT